MAGGFFRLYFQDYTEDRRPGEDGRMHTSRVYRGFLYAPVLTPRQRVLRGILLPLLVLGGGIVFILGAAQRAVCNTLWYTALGTGASLIALLLCVIPLFQCVLAPKEQTVYQYRAGHRALVLLARIGAGCSALTALLALLGTLLGGDGCWVPALCFALCALMQAAAGEIERRIPYARKTNPNA